MSSPAQPKPATIWLALMALTLLSTFVAERSGHAAFAVAAIFVVAAAKGDLVLMHYMEAGKARPHWKIMYRIWIMAVMLMLIAGHIIPILS